MELIWVAVINGVFGIVVLILGGRLSGKIKKVGHAVTETKAEVNETKKEVKNSHTVNFRDDMDSKFELLTELIGGVKDSQEQQVRDTTLLRRTLTTHIIDERERHDRLREDIAALHS
jgi:hypothetical protein